MDRENAHSLEQHRFPKLTRFVSHSLRYTSIYFLNKDSILADGNASSRRGGTVETEISSEHLPEGKGLIFDLTIICNVVKWQRERLLMLYFTRYQEHK